MIIHYIQLRIISSKLKKNYVKEELWNYTRVVFWESHGPKSQKMSQKIVNCQDITNESTELGKNTLHA